MKRSFSILTFAFLLSTSCGDNSNVFLGEGGGLDSARQVQEIDDENKPRIPDSTRPPRTPPLPYSGSIRHVFHQKKNSNKVDLLFSIDHSGSMNPYIQNVARNISAFTERLLKEKVDFRAGFVMSSDSATGIRPGLIGPHPVVRFTDANVADRIRANLDSILNEFVGGTELGVTILEKAIHHPINRALFRDDSAKVFIVLTDADDDEAGVEKVPHFLNVFETFAGGYPWAMIGIGYPSNAPKNCGVESTDHALLETLVKMSGGLMGNICEEDYTDILSSAANRIVKLLSEFSLAQYPDLAVAVSMEIFVYVNGAQVPESETNGFVWDPKFLSIRFTGNAVPPEGAEIVVRVHYRVEE